MEHSRQMQSKRQEESMNQNSTNEHSVFFSRVHDKSDIDNITKELKEMVKGKRYDVFSEHKQSIETFGKIAKAYDKTTYESFYQNQQNRRPGEMHPERPETVSQRAEWAERDPNLGIYEQSPQTDLSLVRRQHMIRKNKEHYDIEKERPNSDSVNPFQNHNVHNVTMENLMANADQNGYMTGRPVPTPIGVLPLYNTVLSGPPRPHNYDKIRHPTLEGRLKSLQEEKLRNDLLISGKPLPPPGSVMVTPLPQGLAVVTAPDPDGAVVIPKTAEPGKKVAVGDATLAVTKPGDVLVTRVPAVVGKNVLPPGTIIAPAGTNAERFARSPAADFHSYPQEFHVGDPYENLWGIHKERSQHLMQPRSHMIELGKSSLSSTITVKK